VRAGYTFIIMNFDQLPLPPDLSIKLSTDGFLLIPDLAFTLLAQTAFSRLSFTFTREHLDHLVHIVTDKKNSHNDRLIASYLLKNACIASKGVLPLCQDTGTAQVFAWKDYRIQTSGNDSIALSQGAETVWRKENLRYSTVIPESFFTEHDAGNNLPAQILITATGNTQGQKPSSPAYRFLFCAKGGGSSNKTTFFQATKAILTPEAFEAFLKREIASLGTAACPPYTIAVVAGGISPEQNLLALKLATTGFFDREVPGFDYQIAGALPRRDTELEQLTMKLAQETGLGAQFGGTALATSAIVLRLPRHGASMPLSIGVSCSAHRNLHGVIDENGIWLEKPVLDPAAIPEIAEGAAYCDLPAQKALRISLDDGIPAVLSRLKDSKPGTPLLLTGDLILARDAAHARWKEAISQGKALPSYTTKYPIMYAGPAKTPKGACSGSLGPTTAGRMDSYADDLMSRGAALITLAKGNRSNIWTHACKQYGGVYLGLPGGVAALIAEQYITASSVLDYPELGMEAVRLVSVKNLPVFLLTTANGEDFYSNIREKTL